MQQLEFACLRMEKRNERHIPDLTICQKPFAIAGKGKMRRTPEQVAVCNIIIRNGTDDLYFSIRIDETKIFMRHEIHSGTVRRNHGGGIPEHSLWKVFDLRFLWIQSHIRKKTLPARRESGIEPEIFPIRGYTGIGKIKRKLNR